MIDTKAMYHIIKLQRKNMQHVKNTLQYNKKKKNKIKRQNFALRFLYKNCISITRGCIEIATKIYL